jgi:hypothetical protein
MGKQRKGGFHNYKQHKNTKGCTIKGNKNPQHTSLQRESKAGGPMLYDFTVCKRALQE